MYLFVIPCDSTFGILGTRQHNIQNPCATSGAGTAYHSGPPQFTPTCSVGIAVFIVSFLCISCRYCFVLFFSSIYDIWLLIWYLQAFICFHNSALKFWRLLYETFMLELYTTILMHSDLVGLPKCMNVFCWNKERLFHFMEYELCSTLMVKQRLCNETKNMVTIRKH